MNNFYRLIDKILGIMVGSLLGIKKPASAVDNFVINGENKQGKILLIKFWGLGNLTVIWPLIYKIKEKYPDSYILFLTFDTNEGFLERNSAINKILYFKITKNIFLIAKQFVLFLALLRKEKINLVINFETFNITSALFSFLTGAPLRIGINNKYERVYYNYSVANKPDLHISQLFADLLKPLGILSNRRYHYFDESMKEKHAVEKMLAQFGITRFICIHTGTSENFKGKRWGLDNFSKLAVFLIENYGLPIIFTGTIKEDIAIEQTLKNITFTGKVFNLSGRIDIFEFVELLRKSCLFISNDTGPAHIAFSLGINTAVIYGPTSPQKYGPLNGNSLVFYNNIECSPCVGVDYLNKRCRNGFKCLDIKPLEAFLKISQRFLNE